MLTQAQPTSTPATPDKQTGTPKQDRGTEYHALAPLIHEYGIPINDMWDTLKEKRDNLLSDQIQWNYAVSDLTTHVEPIVEEFRKTRIDVKTWLNTVRTREMFLSIKRQEYTPKDRSSVSNAETNRIGEECKREWQVYSSEKVKEFPAALRTRLVEMLQRYPLPRFLELQRLQTDHLAEMLIGHTVGTPNPQNFVLYFLEYSGNAQVIISYLYKRKIEEALGVIQLNALTGDMQAWYKSLSELLREDAEKRPKRITLYNYEHFINELVNHLEQIKNTSKKSGYPLALLLRVVEIISSAHNSVTKDYDRNDAKTCYELVDNNLLKFLVTELEKFTKTITINAGKETSEASHLIALLFKLDSLTFALRRSLQRETAFYAINNIFKKINYPEAQWPYFLAAQLNAVKTTSAEDTKFYETMFDEHLKSLKGKNVDLTSSTRLDSLKRELQAEIVKENTRYIDARPKNDAPMSSNPFIMLAAPRGTPGEQSAALTLPAIEDASKDASLVGVSRPGQGQG